MEEVAPECRKSAGSALRTREAVALTLGMCNTRTAVHTMVKPSEINVQ